MAPHPAHGHDLMGRLWASIPANILPAIVAGAFTLAGQFVVWLLRRGADKRAAVTADAADDRAEESADLARAKQLSEGWFQWGKMQEERANHIAAERDAIVQGFKQQIDELGRQITEMKAALAERDALIADQATKIARLEREVRILKAHDKHPPAPGETP